MARAELLVGYTLLQVPAASGTMEIERALAGEAFAVDEGGHRVEMKFPPWDGWPSPGYAGMRGNDRNEPDALSPGRVDVRVEFELPTGDENPAEDQADLDRARRAAAEAAERAAGRAVIRLRAWARVGQPWIGPDLSWPRWSEAPVVNDLGSGRPLTVTVTSGDTSYGVVDAPALTRSEIAAMTMAPDGWPDAADEALAEARLLAQWVAVPDPQRAVLLAAMACELKAKSTWRRHASGSTAKLLEVMLSESRAFPVQAHELFSKVADAIVGRSLRRENRPLANEIDQPFQKRNAIAHRGLRPTIDDAQRFARVALEAVTWLASIDQVEGGAQR